jgi:acyl carrier protein
MPPSNQEKSKPMENATPSASTSLDRVVSVIYSALSELNLQLPESGRVQQSRDTVLFGPGGRLDSLALANFIVITEQKLEKAFGYQIDLTQDDPFSAETGHFRTVQSLAEYTSALLGKRSDSGQHLF